MIKDNKLECEKCATLYLGEGWKKYNKNDLFRKYIENESDIKLKEAYLSAILYRYWNNIEKYYFMSSSSASKEDVYGWLLDAALYTLKKRMWENPKSSIYNDPNGPDKVMNRMIKSFRLSHYEKTNTDKRRLNIVPASIEALKEDLGDSSLPYIEDNNISNIEDVTNDIIKECFLKKDFFTSFMVFNIINQDVFNVENNLLKELNYKKLNYYMRHIDTNICKIFSKKFGFNIKEVESAAKICNSLSSVRTRSAIKRNLSLLSRSKYLKWE